MAFGSIRAWPTDADSTAVVIAEVMTSNASTVFDADGESSDWVEIWNRSTETVDLSGWQLSDGGREGWAFPRLALAAGDRMVVFASGKADRHRLHTDFRLAADGEYLGLLDPNGRVVAEYDSIPGLSPDTSFGIGSDGRVGLLLTPTPGRPNTTTKPTAAAKPQLSRAGGYIDGAISLTATTATDGAQLWYTTDGSTPTLGHGTQYDGPISITTTTTLRMVSTKSGMSDSVVASATFLVMDEVLAQHGTPLGWSTAPINGQTYQFGFDQRYVAEHHAQVVDALHAAPTLSITTDLANLIDKKAGIYSNPSQSGPAWERPASMELIDGDSGFQINGGIRLKGGYFRHPTNPKHSFRLTFGLGYEDELTYPVFGADGVQTFSSLDLKAEQNYGWQPILHPAGSASRNTMMRDRFVRESQVAAGDPGTRSRWVHLFLNGQYWGVYMLRDNITADHAVQLWGGKSSAYDVIAHADDYGYEVDDGDDEEWLQLWSAISDGVVTDDEFRSISEVTDLKNLADFMLINFCVGNLDSNPSRFLADLRANNWQAVGGNRQPFRFFLDDAEHTLGAWDHNVRVDRANDIPILLANPEWSAHNFNPGWLHQVLLTRDEYRALVRDRAATLLSSDGAMGLDATIDRWTELRTTVDPLVEAEAARWGFSGGREMGRPQWEAEVDWVESVWLPRRVQFVRAQLEAAQLLDPQV